MNIRSEFSVTHDMKKIQQGYSRVTVELLTLFAIIYSAAQNISERNLFHTEKKKKKKCWPLNLIFLNSCSKDSEMYLDKEVTLKNV